MYLVSSRLLVTLTHALLGGKEGRYRDTLSGEEARI